jgi:CheY-like chemotaxis protein
MSTGKGLIKEKSIQIFKEVEPNLPQIWGDPVRIRQVLLNLVSNASKFTNEGSITIKVGYKPFDSATLEPERVEVNVIDTGIGIAEADMSKLFEAFRQVDGSTTRQVGGTGLGLAISRQFIEMHGGQMWVTSQVGKGSIFSFTIPLHPASLERSEMVVSTRNGGSRPLVLAVDDEQGVLDLYSRYLDKGGYAIVGFNNANDLLENLREHHPAAVLLDLNLPGKDGWEAINEMKRADEFKTTPIIICSIEDQRERGRNLGVNAYLIKPIVEEDLIRAIQQVTSGTAQKGAVRKMLIVDSDQEYATGLKQAFEDTGDFNARIVGVGYEGINEMMKHRPDVVILDMELPDMDGYGLLTAIRSQPETKDVQVVIISDREVSDEDLARVDASRTHYLRKSEIGSEQIVNVLSELLSGAQASA